MSTSDPLLGRQLGDYKIEGLIGHGGMARVYRGYDEKLDRNAAVKVIEPTLIASGEEDEYRDRFLREARSIARLNHPNIVGVYQFAQEENLYYIAMAYISGQDLREILKGYAEERKLMPRDEMMKILHDIASGLDYAHKNDIIHRDVKPSNIIVTTEGNAVLTDFGLALNAVEGTIGNTFGSVHYIAPEQAISSAQAVPQSDQYSLGVIVYELFAGQVPFDDASAMSVALKHISDPPPPIRDLNSKVTPELEAVVMRALDKEPTNRYESVKAFINALDEALTDAPEALIGESIANRAVNLPPSTPSIDDDAPTIADSKSRPQTIGSAVPAGTQDKTRVPGQAGGGGINMTVVVVAIVIVVALVVGGLLAANSAAEATAATETAVANVTGTAIIVAENSTATESANIENTATAEVEASETAQAESTATAEMIAQIALDNATATAQAQSTATAEMITRIALDNATATAEVEASETAQAESTATARAEATQTANNNATATESFVRTQEALYSPTPSPTMTPSPSPTPSPTATMTPSATHTATPVPTTIPLVAQADDEQLLLRYDGRSILMTNRAPNTSIFIDALVFTKFVEDETGEFVEADTFRMFQFTGAPSPLRHQSCLQMWDSGRFSRPSNNNELVNDSCETEPFWRTLNDLFWADDSRSAYFEVTINGVDLLKVCPTARRGSLIEQRCVILIP